MRSSLVQIFLRCYGQQSTRKLLIALVSMFVFIIMIHTGAKYTIATVWSIVLDPSVKNKLMIIYSTDNTLFTFKQGLFSEIAHVLGSILYGLEHEAAGVKIKFDNFMYSTSDNYWPEYFIKSTLIFKPEIFQPEEIHFNSYFSRFGKWSTFSSVFFGQQPNSKPYPMYPPYSRHFINRIIQQYLEIQPEIQSKIHSVEQQFLPNLLRIGLHYRGTDKKVNTPEHDPSYLMYQYYVKQIQQKHRLNDKEFQLYIATDEENFLQWVKNTWPNNYILLYSHSPRLAINNSSKESSNYLTYGVHKSKQFSPRQKGESALVDAYLLSKTNYLIKNRSGLSDYSTLLNPDLPFIMVLGDQGYSSTEKEFIPVI